MVFPGINDRIAFRMHDFAPPLGLLYIKSFLEKNIRARVDLFNFQTPNQPSVKQFVSHLNAFAPDIVGISVIFGLSADILPQMYSGLAPWIKPLFASSLTLSTVLAIILNQLFSLGEKAAKST